MQTYRTPDHRFENLPDFDFAPHYVEDLEGYDGLRMHYLDEGPRDAEHTYLCLHGEPSWCYLYRKMIPVFVADGGRVIAPDFFGFGRSDKPVDDAVYTFDFHRNAILRLVEHLGLEKVTLVCQDWGGLIGLTLPATAPDLIARLIVMNTAIATGQMPPSKGFVAWKEYVASQPDFDVGGLMQRAIEGLTDAERDAYDAPFEGPEGKAGVRTFPALVPVSTDMPGAQISQQAAMFWMQEWDGDTFMAIGMQDPVLGPKVMRFLQQVIRGCPQPLELPTAGHFVQEQGDVVAREALAFFSDN